MSLTFFVDQCVPYQVAKRLIESGHDVFILKEHIAQDSPDPVVIATAQNLNAILLSLNGDFSDIVTYPPSQYKGIVSLQIRNHPESLHALADRFVDFCADYPDMNYYQGKLLLVEPHRIRVRT